MSQVRKFLNGGLPLLVYDTTFDKDTFKSAMKSNFNAFVANARLDLDQRAKLKQEVENFVNNDIMGQSPEFKTYLDKLYLYKSAKLYDPRKPNFNGNDYILKNFVLQNYNGDANAFAESWQEKDDETRKKDFYNYLLQASEALDYDKFDFRSSKYKTQEEFSTAMKQLAEAINDNDISNDDKDLARSLGIDITTWLNPSTKTNDSSDDSTSTVKTIDLQVEEAMKEWEQSARNAGWTEDQINSLRDKQRKMIQDSLQNQANTSYEQAKQAILDNEFYQSYTNYINKKINNITNWKYPISLGLENVQKDLYEEDKLFTPEARRKTRLADLRYSFNHNVLDFPEKSTLLNHYALTYKVPYVILGYYSNANPYILTVYDAERNQLILLPVFDEKLNGIEDIEDFRQNAKKWYNDNTRSLKNGGTIQFQQGGEMPTLLNNNSNINELSDNYKVYLDLKFGETDQLKEEITKQDREFGGTDYARLLALGTDLAALAASFVPGGAVPSLVAGITSAIVDTGADFADVVKGDMSLGSALWNTAINTGAAFLGMFPAGKTATTLRKVQKWAPRIMGMLGAMGAAPKILTAFNKVLEGKSLEREDWLSIIQGVRLLALGVRDVRTSQLTKKYSIPKELEIPVKSGDPVKLTNQADIVAYQKLKTSEQRNQFLKDKNLIKEDDSVANSLLDYVKGKRVKGTDKEFVNDPTLAKSMFGIDPHNSNYRYIWLLHNWGKTMPQVKTSQAKTTQVKTPLPENRMLSEHGITDGIEGLFVVGTPARTSQIGTNTPVVGFTERYIPQQYPMVKYQAPPESSYIAFHDSFRNFKPNVEMITGRSTVTPNIRGEIGNNVMQKYFAERGKYYTEINGRGYIREGNLLIPVGENVPRLEPTDYVYYYDKTGYKLVKPKRGNKLTIVKSNPQQLRLPFKRGGKINKYLSGGLFPNFKTLNLDINPYRLETDEFGMPKKKPFSFNLNPFTINSGFANIPRIPDYMLTEKERDRRTAAAMLGLQEAKKVTSEVLPLIDKTVSSINGSDDPNPWDNVTKLEDALENRDSILDPYRIKGNILRLQSLYNALNNNKEIYDISLRLLANSVTPTRKVAPSSNVAGLLAEKDRTLNQYRNNSTRPLSSSYEYNNASLLEIEDKIAALEAKYDTAIATQELKDNITATTVANENAESANTAANTNRQYQTALENAKLQAEAAWRNADTNSVNAFLQDLLNQNDNDAYAEYVKRSYAEKYGIDLATSDVKTLLVKDYITRRNERIKELLDERLENGLPTYTPEQAKERAEAELEYQKIALDLIALRLQKAYWVGAHGVPTGRIPTMPNYNLNGINGIYKKGGSLTYDERKALDDNKSANRKKLQDSRNVYNERKSTYDRNQKRESEANKMFRDTQNATVKEIFSLINKAIGK